MIKKSDNEKSTGKKATAKKTDKPKKTSADEAKSVDNIDLNIGK
nr:hypothetical protein [Lentilactobacillus farraginis]